MNAGHDHAGHAHGPGGHSGRSHAHAPADFGAAFAIGIGLNLAYVVRAIKPNISDASEDAR